MVDQYGTPYTQALHVVERYRLVDYDAAVAAEERALKENIYLPVSDYGPVVDANYRGQGLQLEFRVEDEGAFTMPRSATMTYRRGVPMVMSAWETGHSRAPPRRAGDDRRYAT